jgi:hypothetical protein
VSAERRNLPTVIEAAAPVKAAGLRSTLAVPAAIADAGEHAVRRFLEFFAANASEAASIDRYYRGTSTSVRLKREQIQLVALDRVVGFVFNSGNRLTEQHFFEERHGQDL